MIEDVIKKINPGNIVIKQEVASPKPITDINLSVNTQNSKLKNIPKTTPNAESIEIDLENQQLAPVNDTLRTYLQVSNEDETMVSDVNKTPIEIINKDVSLNYYNLILFDFDKIVVKPMYHDQLKKIADFMKANPTAVATVEGHTDNVGSDKYNLNLSRKRSQSVKNYIVKKFGVDPNRITISWYGKSKPAHDNKTEEGRKLNRRAITISIKK